MQSDLSVSGDTITGTLKFIEGGLAESGPLAGDGHFMALKFLPVNGEWSDFDSVKVGLDPSQGTGLVEILNDPDKNGVFKIAETPQPSGRNDIFEVNIIDPETDDSLYPEAGVYTYSGTYKTNGALNVGVNSGVTVTSITVDSESLEIPEKTEDDYYWIGGALSGGNHTIIIETEREGYSDSLTYTFEVTLIETLVTYIPAFSRVFIASDSSYIYSDVNKLSYNGTLTSEDASGDEKIAIVPKTNKHYCPFTVEVTSASIDGSPVEVTYNGKRYAIDKPADITNGFVLEFTTRQTLDSDSSKYNDCTVTCTYTYDAGGN